VRWPAGLNSLDKHVSRRIHVRVETRGGREGFALFGGFGSRHRFRALYLPGSARVRTRLVVHQPVTADHCRRLAARLGLVVFCGDSAPADLAPELLTLPLGVDLEMPPPTAFEGPGAKWSSAAKANIQRIRRSGFTFDVVNGDQWVRQFYRRMLLPSMHRRHGVLASVDRWPTLLRYSRAAGAELLRVLQDGRWVAACLSESAHGDYRLRKLGWLGGDAELFKAGVVSALYWFGLQRAAALGHRRMLLGSAEPWLEDGVLRHKGHWGAGLSADSRDLGRFRLLLDPSQATCLRFLQARSAITRGNDGSFIVFSGFRPEAADVPHTVLASIARWYQWHDRPLPVPEVNSADVPPALRPWVTERAIPRSG
jgi:hypothetical protein